MRMKPKTVLMSALDTVSILKFRKSWSKEKRLGVSLQWLGKGWSLLGAGLGQASLPPSLPLVARL